MPITLPEVWTFPCPRCGEPVEQYETEFAHMMRTEFGPRGAPEHALIVGDRGYPGGFGRWTHSESVPAYNRNTMYPCGDVILGPWSPPQPPVELRMKWAAREARLARKASERAEAELSAIVSEAKAAGMSDEDIARTGED